MIGHPSIIPPEAWLRTALIWALVSTTSSIFKGSSPGSMRKLKQRRASLSWWPSTPFRRVTLMISFQPNQHFEIHLPVDNRLKPLNQSISIAPNCERKRQLPAQQLGQIYHKTNQWRLHQGAPFHRQARAGSNNFDPTFPTLYYLVDRRRAIEEAEWQQGGLP